MLLGFVVSGRQDCRGFWIACLLDVCELLRMLLLYGMIKTYGRSRSTQPASMLGQMGRPGRPGGPAFTVMGSNRRPPHDGRRVTQREGAPATDRTRAGTSRWSGPGGCGSPDHVAARIACTVTTGTERTTGAETRAPWTSRRRRRPAETGLQPARRHRQLRDRPELR